MSGLSLVVMIVTVDAKTGEVKLFEMPATAKVTAPRRGMMDAQDRLWFGEYRGDKIGVFDTKAERFTEWAMPTRWAGRLTAPRSIWLKR